MRRSTSALLAASALALGLGAATPVADSTSAGTRATPAGGEQQRRDVATGEPSLSVRRANAARQQWQAVRRTTARYRVSTGTHKQNRRKQIAANRKRRR